MPEQRRGDPFRLEACHEPDHDSYLAAYDTTFEERVAIHIHEGSIPTDQAKDCSTGPASAIRHTVGVVEVMSKGTRGNAAHKQKNTVRPLLRVAGLRLNEIQITRHIFPLKRLENGRWLFEIFDGLRKV